MLRGWLDRLKAAGLDVELAALQLWTVYLRRSAVLSSPVFCSVTSQDKAGLRSCWRGEYRRSPEPAGEVRCGGVVLCGVVLFGVEVL